jgi:hypothetical protein
MNDNIVLICATGRSGSTTLQRIINTIPNSNICGENFGAINSILEFYINLKKSTENMIPGHYSPASYESILSKNIKPSWYNSYHLEQMKNCIRSTIITMFKNSTTTTLWGFKEIRYDNNKVNLLKAFKELFPQTKVIIQIRENIIAQTQSSWYKDDKNSLNYLKKLNNELFLFYKENSEWCYFTSFEKMFIQKNIQKIFQFIGFELDYDENKVIEILKNNIKD